MKIFSLFTFLLFLGCSTKKSITENVIDRNNIPCIIRLDYGLDSVHVGVDNFKTIEEKLGKGKRVKKAYKAATVYPFPRAEHELIYSDIGVKFITDIQARVSLKRVSKIMVVTSKCKCKTNEGLGIGSSYDKLINVLGYKRLLHCRSWNGDFSELSYNIGNCFVIFSQKGFVHESEFRVEEIEIRNF